MINISLQNMDCLKIEDEWNFSNDTEYLMHTIHTYPAKFPAFIAKKAFDYAEAEGITIKKVADVCKVKTSCTHLQRYLALDYAAINQIDNP